MSDQAQGLRALADASRRDHHDTTGSPVLSPTISLRNAAQARIGLPPPENSLRFDLAPPEEQDVEQNSLRRTHVSRTASGDTSPQEFATASPAARVIAVTSGKGGVGKTNFSSNLSLTLARDGQRVIVLDADLGLANLHVILGISPPFHLEHVLQGEKSLREILCEGPEGIQILGGGSGITELANLDESGREAFVAGIKDLDELADVIVIDTGAGLSRNVLAFLCAVDEVIVVTTPEPTAITDAYATIKVVSQENPSARIMLVVNMAQTEDEAAAVANKIMTIARQFLGISLEWIGSVPHDGAVARAVRIQQPFVLSAPNSAAAQSVRQIARQLGYGLPPRPTVSGVGGLLTRMQRFFGLRA